MLKAALKFARLRVIVMLWALAFIGSATTGSVNVKTILTIFLIGAWYIHATTINDYADLEIDSVNLKMATDRPLLEGRLPLKKLWFLHVAGAVIALALSFAYGIQAVLLTVIVLSIDYGYSLKPLRLSDRGIIAQLVLSFAYVYYPLCLGYWSSRQGLFPWVFSLGLFFAFVARTLLKDFRDITGDKRFHKRTFLIRHGAKTTVLLSALFWLGAATLVEYEIRSLSVFLVLLVAIAEVFNLLFVLGRSRGYDEQHVSITFIAKTANALIITLLVFLLSRHQPIPRLELELLSAVTGLTLLAFNWFRYIHYQRSVTVPRSASTLTS